MPSDHVSCGNNQVNLDVVWFSTIISRTSCCIKSNWRKDKLAKWLLSPMICMTRYYVNLATTFGKYENPNSITLSTTCCKSMKHPIVQLLLKTSPSILRKCVLQMLTGHIIHSSSFTFFHFHYNIAYNRENVICTNK